jgi:hypothetical protein
MTKKRKKSAIPRSFRKKFQEHKRAKKAILESKERLLQRAMERSTKPNNEIIVTTPKKEKMSEIILKFAQPLLNGTTSAKEEKSAITTAIIGWNLSLLPKDLQSNYIKDITKSLNPSNPSKSFSDDAHEVFNFLIVRKKSLFPKINRMVVDFELVDTPDGLHLNVVSNVIEKDRQCKKDLPDTPK